MRTQSESSRLVSLAPDILFPPLTWTDDCLCLLCDQPDRKVEEAGVREALLCALYPDEGRSRSFSLLLSLSLSLPIFCLIVLTAKIGFNLVCVSTGHELPRLDMYLPSAEGEPQGRAGDRVHPLWLQGVLVRLVAPRSRVLARVLT
jgi:hypothetical protein